MNFADITSFLRAAEAGSFTVAARELGLTQPGLSRQIQRLERSLGVALFERGRRGLLLTPAGERYRAYAEDVLARHQQLLDELRGAEASLEGQLRIAASTTPAEFLVAELIAAFKALHPHVEATVFTADSERVVEEVADGRHNLGFVGARIERRGLRYDPVATDEVVLAVSEKHAFARKREVPVAALANERFIEREDGSGTIMSVRRALAERGQELPSSPTAMTLTTTQAVVSAVRAGYGVGFVSTLALGEQGPRGVVGVRLAGGPITRSIYLVRDERHVPPPVGRRFAEFVLERAAKR